MNNKISVIVPMYKCEKTLDRCLTSILEQTYKNFELILVNDASPDSSLLIAKNYAKKDGRIIVIDNPHGGVSNARNTGLEVATGEYIQFVDSDDYIEKNMFEKMLSTLIENDADIAVCAFDHPCFKNYAGNQVFDFSNIGDRIRYYQTAFATVTPWNKLYKRSVIQSEFDESIHFAEDELFNLAQLFNAKKIVTIDDVLYNYYVPPKEETSCINSIAKAENFWNSKNTFWYMRNRLTPKARKIIREHISGHYVDDFLYARVFDFMIWEMLVFIETGVDIEGLIIEITNIFKEYSFKEAINYRAKYGIMLKDYEEFNLEYEVRDFVLTTVDMIKKIKYEGLNLKPYHICLDLFAKKFIERNRKKIVTFDCIANAFVEVTNNSTKEAQFVRNYLQVRLNQSELIIDEPWLQIVM